MKTHPSIDRTVLRPRPASAGEAGRAQPGQDEQMFVCPDRDELGFTPSSR